MLTTTAFTAFHIFTSVPSSTKETDFDGIAFFLYSATQAPGSEHKRLLITYRH